MKTHFLTVLTLSLLLCVSCAKQNADSAHSFKILIEDPELKNKPKELMSLLTLANPTSNADFSCFAVNVTGPGVPPSSKMQGCTSTTNFQNRGIGAFSDPKTRGQTIELSVPTGSNRVVDVYGVYPPSPECTGTQTNSSSQGFFLGSKVTNIAADTTVSIPINYQGGAGEITCSNGNGNSVYFASPDGVRGGVRVNPTAGGACVIFNTNLPSETIQSGAFEIPAPTRDPILSPNSVYMTNTCNWTSSPNEALTEHYYFYVSPATATLYSSISFTWKGFAGRKTTGCSIGPDAGAGGSSTMHLDVYSYSTSSWITIGILTTFDSTIIAQYANPSALVVTSGPETGKIVLRAVGGGVSTASDCSIISTDFVEARFIP